ncbi:(Fe-S)-binding protein [Cupriavidus yeoncheonensis]|nr:(Fe-S)-binding protein [Cupriavidus yeoncheonensis]
MENQTDSRLSLDAYVARSWENLFDACTRCGKCVEACPVVPFVAELKQDDPQSVVAGVLDYMVDQNAPIRQSSSLWAKQCNGCEACIPACPASINPRRMVNLANAEIARRTSPTPHLFHKMSRAIRILAAMQLVPADVARLLRPRKARDVDVVFYTGCNAIRTPSLLFNAMSILDALDVNYEVMGGPASCCGIVKSKWEGDLSRGGRVTEQTLHRFGEFKPERVLNWCPSCQIHLTETVRDYREVSFDIDHITKYLIERKDDLRMRFNTAVNLRVLLHTHHGVPQVGRDVLELLQAVPGLTVVDVVEEPGYMCGSSGADRSPALKQHHRAITLDRCKRPDVDAVVSLYHACHRNLCADGSTHGFKVVSFTELLVRALGQEPFADTMEPFQGRNDWHTIAREAAPLLEENGIDMDEEQLAAALPEIFAMAEYKGGLCQFAPDE